MTPSKDQTAAWLRPWGSTSIFNEPKPKPDHEIHLYDTTLRDGEQQSGVIFTVDQKIDIFRALESSRISYIETGMIAASPDEPEVVRKIASSGHDAGLYVLSRAMPSDVQLAAESGVDGVTMEILSNPTLANAIFGWSQQDILDKASTAARIARELGISVNFFLIDATRTDIEWTLELIGSLYSEHLLDAVTLADTFGVADSTGIGAMVSKCASTFSLPIHIHAHNDFGLAVANSLAAVDAGASVVQGTLNGLGERAGNADVAHVAAAMKYMRGWEFDVDFEGLRDTAKLISESNGIALAPNYPVLGEELFDIEAGIAAAFYVGARREDIRYFYPFLPDLVGSEARIVLGKGAGLSNVQVLLEQYGCADASDETMRKLVDQIKEMGTREQRTLTHDEFFELCRQEGIIIKEMPKPHP